MREARLGDRAFRAMLATRQDRRGKRIALLLGAQPIVHVWERHGARGFMTGVRADNSPLKFSARNWAWTQRVDIYAACINPEMLGESSVTNRHFES